MKYIEDFDSFIKIYETNRLIAKPITKHYLGQCDRLRMMSDENEQKWQEMMRDKTRISSTKFIKNTSGEIFLDDDISMKEYINHLYLTDPSTKIYMSYWGHRECSFIQTCGYEYIFV